MASLTIRLPDDLKVAVEEQVASGASPTPDDYVLEMIRRDRSRQRRHRLERLLVERAEQDRATPMTEAGWQTLARLTPSRA